MFVVLDTNHLRELRVNSTLGQRLQDRLKSGNAEAFTCIVAVEEVLSGWINQIRRHHGALELVNGYRRLHDALEALQQLVVLPFDAEAAAIFSSLVAARLRIGTMDLRIASTCIAHDALLLTRNLVDFEKVPGPRVENWLD